MNRNPKYIILKKLKEQLQGHQIYPRINNSYNIKVFMQGHVYAVWDFMLLLKQLQRRLTCVDKIWIPPRNINVARFINEIVVSEETDEHPSGHGFISHYQLYIQAMKEVGADTSVVQDFISQVRAGKDPISTLNNLKIPNYVRKFVGNTLNAIDQPTPYVAGQFFYGRQNSIPKMFQKFAYTLQGYKNCQNLKYYLKRHIQLDKKDHGPLAQKLIEDLAQHQDKEYNKIIDGAINAIQNRIIFWDGICEKLK